MRVVQVDSFTNEPFRGNPAAVCVLDGPRDEAWMANVAREMNLSETAFLLAREDGGWALRWYTPSVEVDLCGHATLAAAHVLWEDGHAPQLDILRFHTRSGILRARMEEVSGSNGSSADTAIVLDFPATPATAVAEPDGLLGALGVQTPVAVAKNEFDYVVQVQDAVELLALRPDMGRLARIASRGVVVTALADADRPYDFVARWFGPQSGVDEDPVTGSAFCCLGPWWSERLRRTELIGYQASARGGTVGVRILGDRVELIGQAVTVMRGELVGHAR